MIYAIAGFLAGIAVYHIFFRPDVEVRTEYTETVTVDSTYIELYNELKADVSKYETLNDSIEYYQNLYRKELGNIKLVHDSVFVNETFSTPLRRYTGMEAFLYGDVNYSALVAGKMLDMTINTRFDVPQYTTVIEKKTQRTVVVNPKGLYMSGGIDSRFSYSVGATYLNNKSLIGYDYQPSVGVHSVRVGWKVF